MFSQIGNSNIVPTMCILTANCNVETINICNSFNPLLGTYYGHDLNNKLINKLWDMLWVNKKSDEFNKVKDINIHFGLEGERLKALPVLYLSRQFGKTNDLLEKVYNSSDVEMKCIDIQWKNISHLNTLIEMNTGEVVSCNDKLDEKYENIHRIDLSRFNVSVVVTFPGISRLQVKYGLSAASISEDERRAIRIMGVHRAIARGGVLMELPCAAQELFGKYDELELRCKEGTNNKYVWKALKDLGKLLSSYFSASQLDILKRAKDITVFSDVPIGLTILEGDEVPLQCFKKISYRPITPLTRHFQIEMNKSKQHYLGKKCKVAMAECIVNNDENRYVYAMSEIVHSTLTDMKERYSGLSVIYEQTYSVESIKRFIEHNKDADILYISAHGSYSRKQNMAGIMVGDEFWIASDDMFVPPVVILSACHTSPRGSGAVNIADMFIRNGALTVLGSFIPVNAKRNLILMTRLFTYILEAQRESRQYKTLDDAWCGVVSTNAIHELMSTSKNFNKWMHDKNREGVARIIDFQLTRCVGRLRASHIYSDTILILKEMLDEENMSGKFGEILDMNNFFPESFFYQFIGFPENVFLYNDIFKEAYDSNAIHYGL